MRRRGRLDSCRLILGMLLVGGLAAGDDAVPGPFQRPRLVAQLGHSGGVTAVAFSQDGRRIVTGSSDSTIRLWDTETGSELRSFLGHFGGVTSVTFAPDGSRVLSGSQDESARVWEVATGEELRRFQDAGDDVRSVAFSADGKWVLAGSQDRSAYLWEIGRRKLVEEFKGHTAPVTSVAFAPDGKRVATGSLDGTARLWDPLGGQELRQLVGHTEGVEALAFSPNGRQLVTGGADKSVRIWSTDTGQELHRLEGHEEVVVAVAFAPDGQTVLTGSLDATARLWDVATGRELRRLEGHTEGIQAVAFAPDGQTVLTGGADRTARLWDVATGRELRRLGGYADDVTTVAFASDGKQVVTGGEDGTARLWDVITRKNLLRLVGHQGGILAVAVSPDRRRVLTGGRDRTARLWDIASGRELQLLRGHTFPVTAVAFSPDGQRLLTGGGGGDATTRIWDAETGQELHQLKGHSYHVSSAAFSPDGRLVASGSWSQSARLWDAVTAQELHNLKHGGFVKAVAFSTDGQRLLTGCTNESAYLWDVQTGTLIRELSGNHEAVLSVGFSPDGQFIFTGGEKTAQIRAADSGQVIRELDGRTLGFLSVAFAPDSRTILTTSADKMARLWEVATGHELCRLTSFHDGTWAVVDPAGRFDAANGGDILGLHWVAVNEPIALDQLKERYYEPGLLAKYLGFNKEPLREVGAFTELKLFPDLQVTQPTPTDPRLKIHLTDRGGGIGRVVVKLNGKEVTPDARDRSTDTQARALDLGLDLSHDPRLIPGARNTIEVQAFNAEDYLSSRGLQVLYEPEGRPPSNPVELWAVIVGVSEYRGGGINLRFAAKDAEDFASALRIAASRLFGGEHVHITLLSTLRPEAAQRPNRANLTRAFQEMQQARPTDILVMYLAGHGINQGGADGDFYYLLCDAQSGTLTDPEVRRQVAISSRELTELTKTLPPNKQVMILDTCAAGRAVANLIDQREVPSSQVRALERVKDRAGFHILAGCAADSVSYEASRYGQGLLTYSLLLGIRGAALREEQFVDVSLMFGFARDKVPELARDIGGIQAPVIASPQGASFDIGQVTLADQALIPLQRVRPLLLRAQFQEEEEFTDVLELGRRIDERFRDESARGPEAPIVFVDARAMPNAYQLGGRYRIEGETVTVAVRLVRIPPGEPIRAHSEKGIRFTLSGSIGKLDDLASAIVSETEKRLDLQPDSRR